MNKEVFDDLTENQFIEGNSTLEEAIDQYHLHPCKDKLAAILEVIRKRMHEDAHLLIPITTPETAEGKLNLENSNIADIVKPGEELSFDLRDLKDDDGKTWLVAFTSYEEYEKGESTSLISHFMDLFLKSCVKNENIVGVAINPWGNVFFLTKDLMKLILDSDKPQNGIYFDIGDITQLEVDAIVNAAKNSLLGGSGVDGAIHKAAGPGLFEACKLIGGCETGKAKMTGGYLLKSKYVIHTVGPVYGGKKEDAVLLQSCYKNSLDLAKENDIHTIAFPAISTGVYGYPKKEAALIALLTVSSWLSENPDYGMAVIFSCYSRQMYEIYQEVISDIHKPDNRKLN